jgi:tetratricopeptide (TPR) repeat protein
MDLASKIKGILKQAEIYSTQGLFVEARDNYRSVIELLQTQPRVKDKEKLIHGLEAKVEAMEGRIRKVEGAAPPPVLSPEIQALIKRLFSFSQSEDPDHIALDEAVALTKFGQYASAMDEFEILLNRPQVRLSAAKNILRCHLAAQNIPAATDQYRRWLDDPRFDPELQAKLHGFLQALLEQKGEGADLPDPPNLLQSEMMPTLQIEAPDDVLDINAVRIQIPEGPSKGLYVDYDVSFQSGNVISILIPEVDTEVLKVLQLGEIISNVELTAAVAIFKGSAKVMAKNRIKIGPRSGYFNVDLKIRAFAVSCG